LGDLDPSAPVAASAPAPRRIGVLGGTFDPVHIGHLRGALEVAESLALDELRLTPSARPPHRGTPQVSAKDRLAMVECAVAGVAPLVVDARELQRDKPSYTIDTLELMRAELAAETQVFLLLGWDAFCGLPTWHRWEELLQHCHILVLQRPDADSEPPDALRNLLAARSVSDPLALKGASRHRLRYPPPRSVNCWPAVSRYVSWCPTRSWPTSMRTGSTVRRTE
jgi:nicotinate-nucleotide adenylyltransferase